MGSPNISGPPRFFTVRIVELAEPLNFAREKKSDFSCLETASLNARGVERFDFKRR